MKTPLCLIAAATLLVGCATPGVDDSFAPLAAGVQKHTGARLVLRQPEGDDAAVASQVKALLAEPLSADAAVQLALLQHRGLQAQLAELGIARADLLQAGRLPNPGFSFARHAHGDEVTIERSLHLNLARLIVLPQLQAIERRRLASVQGELLAAMLAHAQETRRAWVQAVAATQLERYAADVQRAAEASAELARRMERVGNFNALARLREQSFYADAALNHAHAQKAAGAARERLTRQLGLWGADTAFRLPDRLPDLPAAAREEPEIERQAITRRLDLQGAVQQAEQLAAQTGLVRTSRFINVLELGIKRELEPGGERKRGWEVSLELPIFDSGDARLARAEAQHHQALHRVAQIAIDARSEVREAYSAYRHAHDIARHHRDELLPLAQRISEENLLRYNGMLIGVFELLADARAQVATVAAAIAAERDFHLALIDLDAALIGKPSLLSMSTSPAAAKPAADPH